MPLARHDYSRRRALQGDLDRYYDECLRSDTARHLSGGSARRKEYCSRVAWSRVKAAGRYPDYFQGPESRGASAHENPLSMTTKWLLGYAAVLGVGAVGYFVYKSSQPPAVTPTPALPPGGTYVPKTFNVAVVGGQTVALTVGDTLNVQLLLPPSIGSYQLATSGAAVVQQTGPATNPSVDTTSIPFLATAPGSEQITATPLDATGNPSTSAAPVIFTVSVSPPPVT